jgi:hypothetical protein
MTSTPDVVSMAKAEEKFMPLVTIDVIKDVFTPRQSET